MTARVLRLRNRTPYPYISVMARAGQIASHLAVSRRLLIRGSAPLVPRCTPPRLAGGDSCSPSFCKAFLLKPGSITPHGSCLDRPLPVGCGCNGGRCDERFPCNDGRCRRGRSSPSRVRLVKRLRRRVPPRAPVRDRPAAGALAVYELPDVGEGVARLALREVMPFGVTDEATPREVDLREPAYFSPMPRSTSG